MRLAGESDLTHGEIIARIIDTVDELELRAMVEDRNHNLN